MRHDSQVLVVGVEGISKERKVDFQAEWLIAVGLLSSSVITIDEYLDTLFHAGMLMTMKIHRDMNEQFKLNDF